MPTIQISVTTILQNRGSEERIGIIGLPPESSDTMIGAKRVVIVVNGGGDKFDPTIMQSRKNSTCCVDIQGHGGRSLGFGDFDFFLEHASSESGDSLSPGAPGNAYLAAVPSRRIEIAAEAQCQDPDCGGRA